MNLKFEKMERVTAFCALGALVLVAMGATVKDRFNGTIASDFWQTTEDGGAQVRQAGGKLLFSAQHESEQPSFAGRICSQYALDCTKPWTITFDYALKQGPAPAGAFSGALLLLGFEEDGDQFQNVVGYLVYKSPQGIFLGKISAGEQGIIGPEPYMAVPAAGTLTVSYNAARDRMQLSVNNRVVRTVKRFRAADDLSTQAIFGVGSLTDHGQGNYKFTDAIQVDNFKADGAGVVVAPWN